MEFVISKKRKERDPKEESPAAAQAADRLSELPDDILLRVISLVTVRASVRTSVLSRRWRHLWTHRQSLDFDIQNILGTDLYNVKKTPAQRQQIFISSVDKFLQHHAGNGVQKFNFSYPINQELGHNLERWLRLAVASGAGDVEISLMQSIYSPPYDFPTHLFANGKTSSVGKLILGCCTLRIPPNLDGFNTLKAVELFNTSIVDTDFQNLLSVCYVLESLWLKHCKNLTSLKLSSKASALKFLSVFCCCGLERIEVHAMNLVTFEYIGEKIFFDLRNAPRITEATIKSHYRWFDFLDFALTEILPELPQVETLKLTWSQINKVAIPPPNAHRLMYLKQLTLSLYYFPGQDILWVATFLTFAPLLEKYYIKLVTLSKWEKRLYLQEEVEVFVQEEVKEEPREKRQLPTFTHEQLKVVKFSNFSAEENEIELAKFMVNNTIVLEKLVIDTSHRELKKNSKSSSSSKSERSAVRQRVNDYFVGKLPSNVKFVLL